jgi:hypothetical protein
MSSPSEISTFIKEQEQALGDQNAFFLVHVHFNQHLMKIQKLKLQELLDLKPIEGNHRLNYHYDH